ncbi:hypothetical protein O988_03451 [Pseudogymnoascus sp. VKM F-3808]|nr:hypothetical protein O988_03451 [Pseudogymnoascus sp. VKM F-3808]
MRFQILSLLAIAGVTAASQWAGVENLPDGAYSGVNHPDGSTTMTSLESGESFTFSLTDAAPKETKRSDYAISKRDTDCWGYELDHGGVDDGFGLLKNWAGTFGRGLSSGDGTNYYGFNSRGVYVYYCINAAHSQGNLDITDINYAALNMDSTCGAYQAGYYLWNGSAELVGKARSGTAVCLG